MHSQFKYFAFISYSSKDTVWGKKLQKKLENYRMPATLCSEHGWERTPIKPVFFAPTDIQPNFLDEELQERLRISQHLIVICSPNSAQSDWVAKEVEFFHSLGRANNIHFFIVEGTPNSGNSETECFNPVIKELGLPEILGANIHEKFYRWPWLNKERAYVQLISKLLGVEFDAIWQRHKRLLMQKALAWALGIAVVIAAMIGIWKYANQPFDAEIRLNEVSFQNDRLSPLNDADVTMILDNEKKTGKVFSLDSCCIFTNIPHNYFNKLVHFTVVCRDFLDVDTVLALGRMTTLNIQRDPATYGNVQFWLYNPHTGEYVANETVYVDGIKTTSGNDGRVELFISLENQKKIYKLTASFPLDPDSIIMDCLSQDATISIK